MLAFNIAVTGAPRRERKATGHVCASSGLGSMWLGRLPSSTPLMIPRPVKGIARMSSGSLLPAVAGGKGALSYKVVCENVADAIIDLAKETDGKLRFTVDVPPERSETRAGTLVSRFENNQNLCEKILVALGCPVDDHASVGGTVMICDNINPQGGGEYLTDDEVMVGQVCDSPLAGRRVMVLINAGVDAATLRQVRDIEDDADVIVLLNCGLDRLSFFARLGFGDYFDSFETAYYLKVFPGMGYLYKVGRQPWRALVMTSSGLAVAKEYDVKPQTFSVEQLLRSRAAAESAPKS